MGKTRLEELFYELYASSKQHDPWQRHAMIVELRNLLKQPLSMKMKGNRSDSMVNKIGIPEDQVLDDEELVETEVATELIGFEDGTVKREANATMISAIDKEEPISPFQVPIANSENFRSNELGKADLELEKLEHVVMNENLEQDWVQKNVKVRFEADGDVGKGQEVISNTKICCAHKVFGKMSQHQERLGIKKKKKGKSWMFKYKKGNKKRDLLLLNGKDSLALRAIGTGLETVERDSSNQEKSKLCTEDKGELKGCSERLQSSVLMKEESESMVVNEVKAEFKTFDRKRSDMALSLEDKQDDEHEQNQVIKLISSLKNRIWEPGGVLIEHDKWNWLETCYNHGRLMRFRHWMSSMCWKETQDWIVSIWSKIQVFSDFDIASLVGLEIYGCETKKQINIDHISLNGMCNKLVYDEEKKKLRHVGDDVKKGKNSFLRDVKIILALAVKEYRMGKADERLLPGHYGLLHTFDQRGGLNATVIAGTIMQSSLKLFHQLRVACLHHTSLGFLYGSLPRPPEENHSNFSNMLQYHETWSCISLRNNRVWDPGGSLVDAATPCLLSLHFTALHFIAAILSFLKTLRSRFLQRREICYRKNGHGLVNGPSEKMGCT